MILVCHNAVPETTVPAKKVQQVNPLVIDLSVSLKRRIGIEDRVTRFYPVTLGMHKDATIHEWAEMTSSERRPRRSWKEYRSSQRYNNPASKRSFCKDAPPFLFPWDMTPWT